jgi:hypothetical protein
VELGDLQHLPRGVLFKHRHYSPITTCCLYCMGALFLVVAFTDAGTAVALAAVKMLVDVAVALAATVG